jgi:hypothetical protein
MGHEGKLESLVAEASRNYPDQSERLSRALVAYRRVHARANCASPDQSSGQRAGPGDRTAKSTWGIGPFSGLRRLFAIYSQSLATAIALDLTLVVPLRWAGIPISVLPAQANLITQCLAIGMGIMSLIAIRNPTIAHRVT